METQHIRYVRTVAEHGNISAAARDLGMTQPALTKIVSRIEDLVGAKLFDRGPRGVTLTPYGVLFLEKMERVEHEMDGLETAVRARRRGLSGSVSLGVGQFWLGHILPEVVARMARTYPGVQIRIRTGPRDDLMQRLKLGEIDFMLARIVDELPAGVAGEPLAEVRMHLLARQGHPLAGAGQVRVETLAQYGWVLPPQSDPTIRHGFIDAGLEPPLPRIETVSHNVTFGLLKASDMVTVIPDISFAPPPEGLVRLPADWLSWSRDVGVMRLAERSFLPCCETFLSMLRQETTALSSDPAGSERLAPLMR